MKFGITTKLGLLLASVIVLAAGLTGYYVAQTSRAMLIDAAKNDLLTSTRMVARRVALYREEVSRNLNVVAGHPASLKALTDPSSPAAQEAVATAFEQIMRVNKRYFQLRLIAADDNGIERVRVDRDANGHLLHIRGDDLQEKGHFPYVSGALGLAAGEIYLSRIVINHERGAHAGLEQPTAILATPVKDGQGKSRGVVVVNVDFNAVFASLANDLPNDFQLFLANRKGDILLHPDATQAFGFDRGRRILIQDEFADTQRLVDGTSNAIMLQAQDGRYAGKPIVAAFVTSRIVVISEEERLILGVGQPLNAVIQQAEKLGQIVIQLVAALCAAGVLVAMLVARAVTRPINSLSQSVEQFSLSRQTTPLPVQRQDEIGALARSVRHMQEQILRQLEALNRNQDALEHLVRHDTLTGLPNRRLFQERLDEALARAQRGVERFALMFIDVDNFKGINDRWGHDGGDAVLKVVAQRLRSTTRKVDTVARLGGDEFVVLLDNPAHREDIAHIAEKLLDSVRLPIVHQGIEIQVGFSIGIAQYPEDGLNADTLMANADKAMYATKTAGRNSFRFSNGLRTPTNPAPLQG